MVVLPVKKLRTFKDREGHRLPKLILPEHINYHIVYDVEKLHLIPRHGYFNLFERDKILHNFDPFKIGNLYGDDVEKNSYDQFKSIELENYGRRNCVGSLLVDIFDIGLDFLLERDPMDPRDPLKLDPMGNPVIFGSFYKSRQEYTAKVFRRSFLYRKMLDAEHNFRLESKKDEDNLELSKAMLALRASKLIVSFTEYAYVNNIQYKILRVT